MPNTQGSNSCFRSLRNCMQFFREVKKLIGAEEEQSGPAPVTLHVYDLGTGGKIAGVNIFCRAIGTGAFHAGVEVYGKEWSFGGGSNGPSGTGVFCCAPQGCDSHSYREGIFMGNTLMSKSEVTKAIKELADQWPGDEYDLLRHNCCHFSDTLSVRLGVGHVPSWVTSLAGVGAMLRSQAKLVAGAPAAVPQLFGAVADRLFRPAVDAPPAPPLKRIEEEQVPPLARAGYPAPKKAVRQGSGYDERSHARQPAAEQARPSEAQASSASSTSRRRPDEPNSGQRLAAGDKVEIFSNSKQCWFSGQVKSVDTSVHPPQVLVNFWVSGSGPTSTGELASKNLPMDHKDVRKLEAGLDKKHIDKACRWSVGDWVEVYSNSQKSWCPARVTQASGDKVKVVFQLPGSPADEWMEKYVEAAGSSIRQANDATSTAFERHTPSPMASWNAMEATAYQKGFDRLKAFSAQGAPGTIDSDTLVDFLKGSGVPRKVLKQVWRAVFPSCADAKQAQAGFSEFALCCRLIGHCQASLRSGELSKTEILEQAGDQLASLLAEEFARSPPHRLPDFNGQLVGNNH